MNEIARIEQPTPMELLQLALSSGVTPEVMRELVALQQSAERFSWEREERQAKIDFDDALNRCQEKMTRISTDSQSDKARYASYAKLDRIIRPIYTKEGFSLSFGESDCPIEGKTRFIASLSRSGITRIFQKDMTASTKGPKGNDVLTPIHAEAAADSYAKRYLLKDIFNVAIGEDDNDASSVTPETEKHRKSISDGITRSNGIEELMTQYKFAMRDGMTSRDYDGLKIYEAAFQARKKEIELGK